MSLLAGAVHIDLTGDSQSLVGAAAKGSRAVNALHNDTQSAGTGVESAMQRIGSSATSHIAQIATTAFLGLTVAATGAFSVLGHKAIENASKFEQYGTTLKVMLGSQEEATKRMEEYSKFAASTPFELPQIVELGNKLQSIGKYSQENMTQLGDLASAAGKPIDQVSSAFTKLASGQKGIAVDMFRDLLISTEDWTKATGAGVSKSGELMATTEQMMAALPKILADKHFSGMMEEQSKTFAGKMSNLADTFNQKLTTMGNSMLPLLKPMIDWAIDAISKINVDGIIKQFMQMGDTLKSMFIAVSPYIAQIQTQFQAMVPSIQQFVVQIQSQFQAMLPTIQQFGQYAQQAFEIFGRILQATLIPALKDLWNTVQTQLLPALTQLWNYVSPVLIPVMQALGILIAGTVVVAILSLTASLTVMSTIISSAITGAISFFNTFKGSVMSALDGIKQAFGGFIQIVKGIFEGDFSQVIEGAKNVVLGLGKINLYQIGVDMIEGLINGVGSMAGALWNKITELANSAMNALKGALGIKSPSIVFQGFGVDTVAGFNLGIDAESSKTQKKLEILASYAMKPFSGGNNNSTNNSGNPVDSRSWSTTNNYYPQQSNNQSTFGFLDLTTT